MSLEHSAKPQTKNPELVKVDTAFTVLSQVNLLAESNALALDIGGSLAKLIYLQPHVPSKPTPPPLKIHTVDGSVATALSVRVPVLHGTLHFFAVETLNVHKLLRFIRDHWAHASPSHRQIRATGGGSYKYADMFRDEIDVTLVRVDELKCTVAGLNFLLTAVDNEVYTFDLPGSLRVQSHSFPDRIPPRRFVDSTQRPFPYLLVNIGSGVSIIKVTGHDSYERVSGTSLGGGTFWGLACLLLDCKTFEDVIELSRSGNNANVDMLVGDIYGGGSYESVGLDASVIAASFGKATMRENNPPHPSSFLSVLSQRVCHAMQGSCKLWLSVLAAVPGVSALLQLCGFDDTATPVPVVRTNKGGQFRPQDVALSLLRMLSYNIGQIAHLNARVHGLDRIYFGGNFIRDHPYTIADISFAVDFWSHGRMKALFMRHDGYLGAIGAFIGASSSAPAKIIATSPAKAKADGSKEGSKGVFDAHLPNGVLDGGKAMPNGTSASDRDVAANGAVAASDGLAEGTPAVMNGGSKRSRRKRGGTKSKASVAMTATQEESGAVDDFAAVYVDQRGMATEVGVDDGEWTTVTRIRRRDGSQGKPS